MYLILSFSKPWFRLVTYLKQVQTTQADNLFAMMRQRYQHLFVTSDPLV